jgi:hypothetical protein
VPRWSALDDRQMSGRHVHLDLQLIVQMRRNSGIAPAACAGDIELR